MRHRCRCSPPTAHWLRCARCTTCAVATARCWLSTRRTRSGCGGPAVGDWCTRSGLAGAPDVVMTTTMSKALGSQGGVVLGPAAVRDHLIDAARPFIFDTGLAPAAVGAARAALDVLIAEPWRAQAVLENAAALATVCGVAERPGSAVVSVILGEPEVALAAAVACLDRGVRVGCFRPPTVRAGHVPVAADSPRVAFGRTRWPWRVRFSPTCFFAAREHARRHRNRTPESARRSRPRPWPVMRALPVSTSRCANRCRPAVPAMTTWPISPGFPA